MKNKELYLLIITIVILLFIFILYITNEAESKTFYVDKNGEYDFTKIQSAIDAASDGDTIIVNEGTYYETLKINKLISLIGENRETTIINDYNNSQKIVVQLNIDSCIIKGFTIIGPPITSEVKGIDVKSSHNQISDNIIKNTEMGIYLAENTENNSIFDNILLDNKESVSGRRSNNNYILNNEISINETKSISLSYGIYLHGCYTNIVSDNLISNCYTGMRLKGTYNSLIYDNQISNNTNGLLCCCGARALLSCSLRLPTA